MVFGLGRKSQAPPSTDRGERIYAIGDVHGCYQQLRDLLQRIETHAQALPPVRSTHIIVLGDIVDRGPASADVMRFLYNAQQKTDRLIVLQGNHEELMLRALDGEAGMVRAWMRIGGDATLRSFGLQPPPRDANPHEVLAELRRAIPRDWIEWLRALPLTARSGDYLFCHAGIRPGIAIRNQKRADLLWIRDEFLEDRRTRHEAMVVHGHSISTEVEICANRIGIDTGAYRSGVLTALYLEGDRRDIIASGPLPEANEAA
ncbi:metallophosphoesterase family protein [Sphingobium amiense]|uniref:metallophosphoesterase family protein n=1 Tax=Sphingobium amiense TaxID=135719 RepID=UPI00082E89F5|nr:metallophosphoesterase family protein [Sphingobium amiense]